MSRSGNESVFNHVENNIKHHSVDYIAQGRWRTLEIFIDFISIRAVLPATIQLQYNYNTTTIQYIALQIDKHIAQDILRLDNDVNVLSGICKRWNAGRSGGLETSVQWNFRGGGN
jgi:hypothetical protein